MPKLIEGYADRIVVPAGKRDVLVFDDGHKDAVPGFGIRKFASGKASYILKYSVGRKHRRQTLGSVTRGNLKAMRLLASEVKARARLGQDIIAEKQATRSRPAAGTLGQILPKYLDVKKNELRPRSYVEVQRHLQKAWKPLHKRGMVDVTRADIVSVIDDIERSSGKVAADRARTSLSTFFAWSIDRGYCEANPAIDIRARSPEVSRARVLSEAEIAEVWEASLDDDHGRIVRLLILTGQRRTEIGDLVWSELDLEKRQIDLPGHRTRNGRAHIVPLSHEALAILHNVTRQEGRDFLFGKGVGGFSGWSKAKRELDRRIAAARKNAAKRPMSPWVVHDLRRSFVTHMNERGFAAPHVIEAIVNHVSGHLAGVAGVYNKAQYLVERREGLKVWAVHVKALVEGDKGKLAPTKQCTPIELIPG